MRKPTFAQADDEAIDQKRQRVVVEGDTNSDQADAQMQAIQDGYATIVGTTNFLGAEGDNEEERICGVEQEMCVQYLDWVTEVLVERTGGVLDAAAVLAVRPNNLRK